MGERPEHPGGNEIIAHPNENIDTSGRSYVCSMSSAIDLKFPPDGCVADLALTVQRYLSRIVEELHLISAWSSSLCQHQRTARSAEGNTCLDDGSLMAMERLAVATDIELMRRDVTKAQHELFQRCTTQTAYVQSEANAAISRQDTLYSELKQRMDDEQRALSQQTQSLQSLEQAQSESDAQIRSMISTLRQVQQQTSSYPARVSGLEKSIDAVTTTQFIHERELQTLQRRVASFDTTHQLQQEATRRATEESLTGLRSAHSQLSTKLQVLRLEMQKLSDTSQKQIQQLMKTVTSVVACVSGKPRVIPTAAVAPRRPSVTAPRTPRSGGNTHSAGTEASSGSLYGFVKEGGSMQTMITTGADAVATNDCFIYAKTALPHRNSINETGTSTKKRVAPSTGSSRVVTGVENKVQDAMTSLLTVQQSVMSLPLGYEDAAQPIAVATKPSNYESKQSTGVTDRPGPHISTRPSTGNHQHHRLPDVNLSVTQGLISPNSQDSRLHTKPYR
ncbi:hypothetical protein JG688_00009198 [Phytophthora aleatoria]|uniref:Uncharacterized protein n=1 Tax=Phytophthora aleatoria TaxID=2496075 RepID=A0A8J5MFH3_9STRA|nr:hypothetical protein JG688_00009198 [Phytophthora aleatoria]